MAARESTAVNNQVISKHTKLLKKYKKIWYNISESTLTMILTMIIMIAGKMLSAKHRVSALIMAHKIYSTSTVA